MFCQQTKRVKGTETKEKLNLCVELRADKLIKEASLLHSDPRIAALCTDDLTAKEAAYNKSCYQDFTRIVAANKPETIKENKGELDTVLDAVHISVHIFLMQCIFQKVLYILALLKALQTVLN